VYAALFVAAMGLDMTDVTIMIPGVRLADIRRASRLLEDDRALRRANDVVVAFMLSRCLWEPVAICDRFGVSANAARRLRSRIVI
jgi:hypothetical protein